MYKWHTNLAIGRGRHDLQRCAEGISSSLRAFHISARHAEDSDSIRVDPPQSRSSAAAQGASEAAQLAPSSGIDARSLAAEAPSFKITRTTRPLIRGRGRGGFSRGGRGRDGEGREGRGDRSARGRGKKGRRGKRGDKRSDAEKALEEMDPIDRQAQEEQTRIKQFALEIAAESDGKFHRMQKKIETVELLKPFGINHNQNPNVRVGFEPKHISKWNRQYEDGLNKNPFKVMRESRQSQDVLSKAIRKLVNPAEAEGPIGTVYKYGERNGSYLPSDTEAVAAKVRSLLPALSKASAPAPAASAKKS